MVSEHEDSVDGTRPLSLRETLFLGFGLCFTNIAGGIAAGPYC